MDAIFSKSLKAGKSTYFIDVKEAKNKMQYLAISESKFQDGKWNRKTILIFGEGIEGFRQAIGEAADVMSKQ